MFKLPENLSEVEDLTALRDQAIARQAELNALTDDDLTDELLDELESIPGALEAIDAAAADREQATKNRAERIAAARAKNQSSTEDGDTEKKADEPDEKPEETEAETPKEPEVTIPDDASELIESEEKEPVMASGSKNQSAIARARGNATEVEAPEAKAAPSFSFRSSSELGGEIRMGEDLESFRGLARAFNTAANTVPQNSGGVSRRSVGVIQKPVNEKFHLKSGDVEGNTDKLFAAANQQLVGVNAETSKAEIAPSKSLVAAGGWFAPAVVDYTIPVLEQEGQGNLVLPTVTMERGRLSFTKGVDFSDIYAESGFALTEAQVMADTAKNFIDVEAPEFEDVELDVIGYGVRAGFLTAKAWPELIARYLAGVKVAHSHKKNASIISRVVAKLGAAHVAGKYGSAVADSLLALELEATRLRYKYRLAVDAPIEGMAPLWVMNVYRADLAYQQGVDQKSVTDAQVNAWLSARHISLQWVYDWQDLAGDPQGTTDAYPTSANVGLWVQGAFVQGELDVVTLDNVYDTASLTVNTYTAAFFEEAIAVFNPQASGVLLTLPTTDYFGRFGAPDITNKPAA